LLLVRSALFLKFLKPNFWKMKKTICVISLMTIAIYVFGQVSPVNTDYLQKSKRQKSAAFTLLGGGSALIITGLLIGNNKNSSFGDAAAGGILGGLGVVSVIGSIPLFNASGRNKRKANTATTFFKIETMHTVPPHSLIRIPFPAISVKFSL
jgi:hypothetical protein